MFFAVHLVHRTATEQCHPQNRKTSRDGSDNKVNEDEHFLQQKRQQLRSRGKAGGKCGGKLREMRRPGHTRNIFNRVQRHE